MGSVTLEQEAGHPSPHRHRVALGTLIFGLSAGPAAWSVAWMTSVALAQEACYPGTVPLTTPAFGGVHVALVTLNGLACAVTVAGGMVAYRNWRKTRTEHPGPGQTLLEIGEGRARFMAMAGILTSAGFLLALLFGIPAIVFGPLC
jgi:hypothetical protein